MCLFNKFVEHFPLFRGGNIFVERFTITQICDLCLFNKICSTKHNICSTKNTNNTFCVFVFCSTKSTNIRICSTNPVLFCVCSTKFVEHFPGIVQQNWCFLFNKTQILFNKNTKHKFGVFVQQNANLDIHLCSFVFVQQKVFNKKCSTNLLNTFC